MVKDHKMHAGTHGRVRAPGGVRCGCPGVAGRGAGARWFEVLAPGGGQFGWKSLGKAKFGGFRGGKGGDCWGGARSTCQTSNPWTKTTKSHKI